jgi:UDP-glucose:glycoprotein glucosyltransferase
MHRRAKVLPFDHVYNPSVQSETAVLYADIQTDTFKTFHSKLKHLADQGVVRYILRYRPGASAEGMKDKPLFVSGYGVELMLKRTDYIVIDDREVETGTSQEPPPNGQIIPRIPQNQKLRTLLPKKHPSSLHSTPLN